nr:restriction endonuclease [Ktedonobacteraceae bacterium]
MEWVSTMKPSFLEELRALSPKVQHQIATSLSRLLEDPKPNGRYRNQLRYLNTNLYALRSGDYRIYYTFTEPYVSFLKLIHRSKGMYKGESEEDNELQANLPAEDFWEPEVSEEQYNQNVLIVPELGIKIARISPSFTLYTKLLEGTISLDSLKWREFEELVADLLEKDGYQVELGPGRNDGGKDIIAIKKLEPLGKYMSVWQAKKLQPANKVGIEVIRELADTRNEHKASKGIIVTTTFLTKPALERVRRDQYILDKIDRDDLFEWMRRLK